MAPGKRWRRCWAAGCAGEHLNSLYSLPSEERTRTQWLRFIYGGNVPSNPPKSAFVCRKHFQDECFHNVGPVESGFSTRLLLKNGSVPRLRRVGVCESVREHVDECARGYVCVRARKTKACLLVREVNILFVQRPCF